MNHLYRKSLACAIALLPAVFLCFNSPSAHAQRPELRRPTDQQTPAEPAPAKTSKRGARAIAVVEFLPGGGARLVPVALWMDGKYYDASLYKANPAPFAIEPGTVYEAQSSGERAGIFVVNMPKLSNAGWIGDGRWTPRRALDAQIAATAAKQPKPQSKEGKATFTGGADDGPPVLRRPGTDQGSTASSQTPASTQPSATAAPAAQASQPTPSASESSSTPGRPTLRRPSDEASAPPATPAPQPARQTVDDNDPDRPVLRKPSVPAPTASATANAAGGPSSADNDPDRPVLTRGTAPANHAPSTSKVPVSGVHTGAGDASTKGATSRSLVAISDAGKYETRPLVYATTPERQQLLTQALLDLALADVRSFAAKHKTSPQLPKSAAIKDYDIRFFDLDFSNSPTLALTAKLPVPAAGSRPFVYYATVVARLDINGDPVKVFSSVSDTTHLDVFPRLELIDAIDADGKGRGDLLFRQYSDTGMNYGLYRVFPYNMEKIFEGGASL